jgi:hypothetical protein
VSIHVPTGPYSELIGILFGGYTYLAAGPSLVSVSPTLGDTEAGSRPVTLTGLRFTGTTGVTFGGVAATSVSVVNDTTVTCVPPAHASGVVDVIITTPGGSSPLVSAYEFFSPKQLALTAFWRDYPGSAPWTGTASAGTSGALPATTAGHDASSGAPINGHVPAAFNHQYLDADQALSSVAGSISILMNPSSLPAQGASPIQDAILYQDSNDWWGVGVSIAGARGWVFDGAYKTPAESALPNAQWTLLQMKWNGVTLYFRTNGNTWQSVAAGPTAGLSAGATATYIGEGSVAGFGADFIGEIAELAASNTVLSDATFDKIRGYILSRYGLTV